MTKMNWDEIEASLRKDIEKKRVAHVHARQDFENAITPSGIPQPDGTVNTKNAALHTSAIKAHRLALTEHHDFILRGTVPDRFSLVGPPHTAR
jgi:hypothetical protein